MNKKLYRSNKNKLLGGVMGGIGEYFDVDPTMVRLGFVVFSILTHLIPAIIIYIIAVVIIPMKDPGVAKEAEFTEKK